MSKHRLTQSTRTALVDWMLKQYDAKAAEQIAKPKEKAIEAANKAVRAKYPEADMAILRKYKCVQVDRCLRFVTDGGQVFGLNFNYSESADGLADIPSGGGCTSSVIYPISAAGQKAVEAFVTKRTAMSEERNKKYSEYHAFLAACKTVEDVNEVVPLPDDLKKQYMGAGALIAINPDVIASIKSDFKKAA